MKFTIEDVGCIADGAKGHQYCREILASIMAELSYPMLADELAGRMPDDASDEIDALDILNSDYVDGVYIDFVDGDLLCLEEEE